ncbi:MAG: DUF2283 domain-containing protein [Nitrospirae bacterium]|nr:DUF2283 domain-containing protein [Nitrospirota bacterium]
MLKISYDKEGDVLEIRFSDALIEETEYIDESGLTVDFDGDNNIVAFEIISFSKRVNTKELSEVLLAKSGQSY